MQAMNELDVARAIAYFEASDDLALLQDMLRNVRPRAAQEVRRATMANRAVSQPADIDAAPKAASREEAIRTLRATKDFAQLQALARAIGRRIEALMAERR